ncbi:PEGA domain-containing protein [Candidatus Uabimicrobium amorphum]|uniref:Uncharacterized protein n=1 Tax=Uabimicrobium amorphum TaxID=2596890 RepID=A0A5S9INQ9_UABAM|nr:PEGA domain-containing protein [Candidatus Uabimicrobium amorphum]BBM84701.1 hypothetical protein UABAM_03062 [Candidatus Uabimicrobium amorphum]
MIRILIISCCLLSLYGCKTSVVIHSEPGKAVVYSEGKKIGVTPCKLDVEFWREYITFSIEKKGYITQDHFIVRRFLDGTGGFFTLGWPEDVHYRLMSKEEQDRRRRWLKME